MMDAPTLRDVAELAGVSLSTASLALNNRNRVAAATRQKVREAARTLGYHPQGRSPSVFRNVLKTVGIITISYHSKRAHLSDFYEHVLYGVEEECQRHNLSLLYGSVEVDDNQTTMQWPSVATFDQADGIIVVGAFIDADTSQMIQAANKPVVLVSAYAQNHSFDSVLIDNKNGAMDAVAYLAQHGHKHIGLIGSHPNAHPSFRARREGYLEAVCQRNLLQYVEDSIHHSPEAELATFALLQREPQITAIFACSDVAASGVLSAASKLGRVVPDDLSIVGFDNSNISIIVTPKLTTMHVDTKLLGILSIGRLLERAAHPERPVIKTIVRTEIVERDSVVTL